MHDKYKKTGDPAVGSTRLVRPVGRCIACGSGSITGGYRTSCVLCLDCGTEVTEHMHRKKQPNVAGEPQPRKPRT